MLAIIDLYSEAEPTLAADDIIARLGCSRPTGYRYVRELVSTGLLVRTVRGFSLGPRIIELDRQIRRCDPLLAASRDIVRDLADRTGCNVTQMRLYGDRIVTIHHEPGPEPLAIDFDRGRPMPLFRGAPSRAILAFLPRDRLRRLYERHRDELPVEVRRRGFARFAEQMQAVRRTGFAVSLGELEADKVGIAAPLRDDRQASGSLCLVLTAVKYSIANQPLLAEMVVASAARIDQAIGSHSARR